MTYLDSFMFAWRRIKTDSIPQLCVAIRVSALLVEKQSNLNAFVRGDFLRLLPPLLQIGCVIL